MTKVGRLIKRITVKRRNRRYKRWVREEYLNMLKVNNMPSTSCDGEQEWLRYWKMLGVDPLKENYRVFYPYMGATLDILPSTTDRSVVSPVLNPPRTCGYYSDKNFLDKVLPQGFCPKTMLRKVQGHYYDVNYKPIVMDEGIMKQIFGQCGFQRLVVKPTIDTNCGIGVELFAKGEDGNYRSVKDQSALTFDWLQQCTGPDIIVQEAIEQSDFMSQFNSTSVNTLRMAMYRSVKDEQCHLIGAVLRMGASGNYLDNVHAGGRYVGISQEGELCKYTMDRFGIKQEVYNGIDFSKVALCVPNYDKIKEFAIEVLQRVVHHRLLALDIAIRKDGTPVLVEYNIGGYDMTLYQFFGCSGLGNYAAEVHDYCLEHKSEVKEIVTIAHI